LRPLQRRLAADIGVQWNEFALISPDIWRKQLLDYASLGPDYKYAGAFTGEELQIVDHKLDRYMARKAERGAMSHLLIDRFRFDSFAPDSGEAGGNLLTVRPHRLPVLHDRAASLVERRGPAASRWTPGRSTIPSPAVEAYSGIPQLFFVGRARGQARVHFEFSTIACRWESARGRWPSVERHVERARRRGVLDVERYRQIDIGATAPELLHSDAELLAPEKNTGFLRECIGRSAKSISRIRFPSASICARSGVLSGQTQTSSGRRPSAKLREAAGCRTRSTRSAAAPATPCLCTQFPAASGRTRWPLGVSARVSLLR
jgi:hypothetical protein